MNKLYQLTHEYNVLTAMLDNPDVPDEAVLNTLEGIQGEIEVKAENLLKVVAGMNADVTAVDVEIKRLAARKRVLQNRANSLRDYLKTNMQQTGIRKIKCPYFLISLASGRDVAVVEDPGLVPDDFCKITRTPDKVRILTELKQGQEVPGCRLGQSSESLRIK